MKRRLMLIGASGHGRVIADIARCSGYDEIAFLDDNTAIRVCGNYPVLGDSREIDSFADWEFLVSIGNGQVRKNIQERLEEKGYSIATLIHPESVIGEDVAIGRGAVVMAGSVINPGAEIGRGAIINTCSSVDHDCKIGDFSHVSVGAHLAGTVTLGDGVWVGAGAVVSNNMDIAAWTMIGAGAVVVKNITESGTYVGVPARRKENPVDI